MNACQEQSFRALGPSQNPKGKKVEEKTSSQSVYQIAQPGSMRAKAAAAAYEYGQAYLICEAFSFFFSKVCFVFGAKTLLLRGSARIRGNKASHIYKA